MIPAQLIKGLVVAAALAVLAVFFIFNPFTSTSGSDNSAASVFGTNPSSSGLVIQDEIVGSGDTAQPGDTISVNYTGKLDNGIVFDSSVGKAPYSFILGVGNVISGWDQGLVGMKVGGKRILIIPPSLAYGSNAVGPIPANATLQFEVELVSVKGGSGATGIPQSPYAQ